MAVKTKRVYLPAEKTDGYRVLVDRIWPRGLTQKQAALDLWIRDVAPSTGLRKWFGHDVGKWVEFKRRYQDELGANPEAVASLLAVLKSHATVTLLFGAADEEHNQAVVLAAYLRIFLNR
ncbi:protein containing DUF488 [mine drainage metagenome]|uniref:Protein containing DUF488 n=1 Tax=mine drainage metagenome TaxID=410659 RepID=T1BLT5_9ZZZZ